MNLSKLEDMIAQCKSKIPGEECDIVVHLVDDDIATNITCYLTEAKTADGQLHKAIILVPVYGSIAQAPGIGKIVSEFSP